eukprot:TRINITY_DN14995_c0_g1_i2.p1 TRINITY_DN14995_c0_g1~~TRINITY_DN14995_c0_g1_i2.p1  ORF type:complete len:587 (+),score=168.31 TRINITY_DN14995_c0_g1_i2:320-2080(+)
MKVRSCAHVLGRIAMAGQGRVVGDALLAQLAGVCDEGLIPSLVHLLPGPALSVVLRSLFARDCPALPQLTALLGTDSAAYAPELTHVLTSKLVTSVALPKASFRVLFKYLLATSHNGLLLAALHSASALFADPELALSLHPALHTQLRRCLCWGLQSGIELAPDCQVLLDVIHGVPLHLSSPIGHVRACGMRVAAAMSLVLSPDNPLQFDVSESEESCTEEPGSEQPKEPDPQAVAAVGECDNAQSNVWGSAWDESESSSDAEEDTGFSCPKDDAKPDSERPKSLGAAILSLRKEDANSIEAALQELPSLLEHAPNLELLCDELCCALLHTSNAFDIPEFVALRRGALVTLVQLCPVPAAGLLTTQFYTQNVSMEVRLLILETVSGVACEMSGVACEMSDSPVAPSTHTPLGISNNNKTRRWTLSSHTRANEPKPQANRFGAVAGLFFFPLMTQFDNRSGTLDMLNPEHVLPLGQLLCTLGTVLEAANNSTAHPTMACVLLEFLLVMRLHSDEYVERCAMFALSRVLLTTASHLLRSERFADYLSEIGDWIDNIAHTSSSPTNQQCACTAQKLLQNTHNMKAMVGM